MGSITLSKVARGGDQTDAKESKGRNGWFVPARAAVLQGPHDSIALEVWSKRETGEPPIDLYLTDGDAAAVGNALVRASGVAQTLLLIVSGEGYSLCTLGHVLATNSEEDDCEQVVSRVKALRAGEGITFGGGAAPLVTITCLEVNAI